MAGHHFVLSFSIPMKMKKLTTPGKISIPIVILCLATLWVLPMWQIDLRAPQYPDGLKMKIWINNVTGDVDIINGLNHYIGMKTIHKEDFREFVYLPAVMLSFMALGIAVLLLKRKTGYYIWTGMFIIIGLLSFYDFYKWEYEYGHTLDPNAPIKVPGMSYQPPLLGYKKMLNFEALSQPDWGGYFYLSAGVLLLAISIYEFRKSKTL